MQDHFEVLYTKKYRALAMQKSNGLLAPSQRNMVAAQPPTLELAFAPPPLHLHIA